MTVPAPPISAAGLPRAGLLAASLRAAVVKSSSRSARRIRVIAPNTKSISRSTRAPLGIEPDVGTPICAEAAGAATGLQ